MVENFDYDKQINKQEKQDINVAFEQINQALKMANLRQTAAKNQLIDKINSQESQLAQQIARIQSKTSLSKSDLR